MSDSETSVPGWASIPRAIQRDSTVSAAAKLVYLALSSRVDEYGQTWPKVRTIAAEASVSESTAKRALQELRDRGFITWVQQHRDDGSLASNRYQLGGLNPGGFTQTPGVGSHRPQGGVPVTYQERTPENEHQKERSSSPAGDGPSVAEKFEVFWSSYPRKVGKEAARKAFAAAAKKHGVEVVMAGVRRFAADPNLPETRFVPYPATWLNRGGWGDEASPSRGGRRVVPVDQEWMWQ